MIFGGWLVWQGDRLLESPLRGLLPGRYFLFLMGIFAFFCGLIYNDFLSVNLALFGSCYKGSTKDVDCVYPFGVDPAWGRA